MNNYLSILPALFKLIGHGETVKLLFNLIFGLLDKHKEGLEPQALAADVASGLYCKIDNDPPTKLSRLLFLSLVQNWAIAEAKSLLPNRPPNLVPFPSVDTCKPDGQALPE
jgi:hypothetical protein